MRASERAGSRRRTMRRVLHRALGLTLAGVILASTPQDGARADGGKEFVPETTPLPEIPAEFIEVPQPRIAQAVGAGARVTLLARSSSGVSAPGAVAPFFVLVSNRGDRPTPAGEPVALTIDVPAGLVFAGVTDLNRLPVLTGQSPPPGATWRCSGGKPVRCVFTGRLPGGFASTLLVRFRVAENVQRRSLPVRFAVANARARAVVRIVDDPPRPQLFLAVGGTENVAPGTQATQRVEVMNVGFGAATSIVLTNLLPAKVLGTWRSSGTGWSCGGTVPTCSYTGTVAVGKLAPRLTLTYTLDPDRVAALDLPIGGANRIEEWTITADARGASPASTATFHEHIAIAPPPGSTLMPAVIAVGGEHAVLPGSATTLAVTLANLGKAPTRGEIVLSGTMPAGIELTGLFERGRGGGQRSWPCTTSPSGDRLQEFACTSPGDTAIPAAAAARLSLQARATADARPVYGAVTLSARADNQIESAPEKRASLPLLVLPGDVGFPTLTLSVATGGRALRPVTDGAPAELLTGGQLAERFDVRNAGGAPIAAGAEAELVQSLGAGAEVRSIRAPPGWRCSVIPGARPIVRCAVRFAAALAPAEKIQGPTVIVVPTRPTPGATSWPATVRLTAPGAPKAASLPVVVQVTKAEASLVPHISTVRIPTAGGTGRFRVAVANRGTAATAEPVELSLRVPAAADITELRAPSWNCVPAVRTAVCTTTASAEVGARLPPVTFSATFARRTAQKTLTITARAALGDDRARRSATATADVTPRSALRAVITAPATVALEHEPRARRNARRVRSTITLDGDGSGGSGVALRYVWRQRCTTAADARAKGSRCRGVTPRVQWLAQRAGTVRPRTDHVTLRVPPVERVTTLVFQLTVTDGSAVSSAFARVRVVPTTPAHKGLRIDRAKRVKVPTAGPESARRQLPSPAQRLRNPRPKREAARDAVAAPKTAARTNVTSQELPAAFCNLVRAALAGTSLSQTFGPVSLRLANVRVSGADCAPETTISFSDSSVGLSSFLTAMDVAGSVSKDGIKLTAGTIVPPEGWRAPTLTLGGDGLSLPFGPGTTVAVDGTIAGDGFAFVPLPSGWVATTTVRFIAAGGSTTISVSAQARAPGSEASPDSPVPTASIEGSVASDGSFSLTADFDRIVALQGHAIHISGTVSRAGADDPLEIELAGELEEPFDIVDGLRVDSLSVAMKPTERSLGLTGEGTILLETPSDSLGVTVELEYDDARNWSLRATGEGTASWQPLPGLTIRPDDVRGAIKAEDNEYEFTLKVTPGGAWTPTDAVKISNLELALSNTCDETGAPCPRDAAVYLDVAARAAFELPSVGTVTAAVRGALALPSGDFSIAAALTNPIDLGAGISIDTGEIELTRGMPTPAGTATLGAEVERGGLRLSIHGSATLPGIGKVPSIEAAYSDAGFTVAAQLGSFPIPGGDDSKLRNTIVGWSSFDTKLSIVDPVTKKLSTVELPANKFKISASFATPDWLQPLLKTNGDLHGRATGSIDLSSGEFALRAELEFPDDAYVYGNAGSATSVRMKSAYFDIALKGADFTLTLGGKAALAVAATESLPASDVDLGVAFGFSAATQTIVGQLSLASEAGWRSAFGIEDLTLYDLAVDFQLNLSTLTPALGVGARAVLPALIRDPLGIPDGVQTTVVANLSITNPCIGLEINDPQRRGGNVLDIARRGVLTATELEIQIAPTGCKVGRFEYAPGLSINFDGAIAGVAVHVHAHMGVSPFALDAKVDIGSFTIGGLTVHQTSIAIAASPSQLTIAFSGGVDVLGTTVELSGGFQQKGATSIIDFRGNLSKLNLGVVNVQQLVVDAHVEAGPDPSVRFIAKGSIELLGSAADAEFTLGIRNGALESAKADVKARLVIGGPGGLVLNGTFKLDYQPGKTFAVDATVAASVGGFDLGTATVSARQSSFTLSANLTLGGVFTAKIDGAVYFGDVPVGTLIDGPGGTRVAARSGDFVLSAKDVTLNLGGFSAKGTVALGRAGGNVWGNVATKIQLLGSAGDNSIAIAGSFNSNGNFSFRGTGSLNVVGTSAQFDVEVARSGAKVTIHGETTVSVLGSRVSLAGDFESEGGTPRVRLRGAANLNVAGYNLGNGRFTFSNYPSDAGLFAEVDVSAGSVLRASGRLTIVGNRFYLGVNANLDLRVLKVPAQVVFTNCTDATCRTAAAGTTLNATATVYAGGFSFGVSVRVSSDGSFSATARSPASGRFYGRTPDIYLLVVAFYANYSYEMQLTISSNSPYVAVRGYGSGDLYGKSWGYRGWFWWGWSGWSHIVGITASINTNPTEVCGYARVWGTQFGGCFRP